MGGFARFGLLDVFQPELQLVYGQRLGAAAEAVALQLLDDLVQPSRLGRVIGALGQEHGPQGRRIVWKRWRFSVHKAD